MVLQGSKFDSDGHIFNIDGPSDYLFGWIPHGEEQAITFGALRVSQDQSVAPHRLLQASKEALLPL